MRKEMSIMYHRPTPRTNWITALLLAALVTAFGILAEAHFHVVRSAQADAEQHSLHYTAGVANREPS